MKHGKAVVIEFIGQNNDLFVQLCSNPAEAKTMAEFLNLYKKTIAPFIAIVNFHLQRTLGKDLPAFIKAAQSKAVAATYNHNFRTVISVSPSIRTIDDILTTNTAALEVFDYALEALKMISLEWQAFTTIADTRQQRRNLAKDFETNETKLVDTFNQKVSEACQGFAQIISADATNTPKA